MNLHPGEGLPAEIVDVIAHCTASLGDTSKVLTCQADAAKILQASPTMLDLVVPAGLDPVDLPDGPTPGRTFVYDGDELIGEVLVWLQHGRLSGLEQAWFTDEPPRQWPSPESLRLA